LSARQRGRKSASSEARRQARGEARRFGGSERRSGAGEAQKAEKARRAAAQCGARQQCAACAAQGSAAARSSSAAASCPPPIPRAPRLCCGERFATYSAACATRRRACKRSAQTYAPSRQYHSAPGEGTPLLPRHRSPLTRRNADAHKPSLIIRRRQAAVTADIDVARPRSPAAALMLTPSWRMLLLDAQKRGAKESGMQKRLSVREDATACAAATRRLYRAWRHTRHDTAQPPPMRAAATRECAERVRCAVRSVSSSRRSDRYPPRAGSPSTHLRSAADYRYARRYRRYEPSMIQTFMRRLQQLLNTQRVPALYSCST